MLSGWPDLKRSCEGGQRLGHPVLFWYYNIYVTLSISIVAYCVMASRANGEISKRPLDKLGISGPEEQLYRWLLKHHDATVAEAGRALSLAPGKTQRLVDALEAKGLATHTPERPRRYVPASPDIALRALITQRRKELQDAEVVLEELQKEKASGQRAEHEQVVELITNQKMEDYLVQRLVQSAQHEMVALAKPPLRSTKLEVPFEEDRPDQEKLIKSGIRYRTVVDAEYMAMPGALTRIKNEIHSGEENRLFSELPFKLLMSDRKIALVPLSLQHTEGPSLLVKSPALLDALYLLFELIWEKSDPLRLFGDDIRSTSTDKKPAQLSGQMQELVSLMAAGLNDKSIYMESGVSRRTHQTRVSELMQALNARTRFHAGWRAAKLDSENDEQSG